MQAHQDEITVVMKHLFPADGYCCVPLFIETVRRFLT
jgi:hypothetical protein